MQSRLFTANMGARGRITAAPCPLAAPMWPNVGATFSYGNGLCVPPAIAEIPGGRRLREKEGEEQKRNDNEVEEEENAEEDHPA